MREDGIPFSISALIRELKYSRDLRIPGLDDFELRVSLWGTSSKDETFPRRLPLPRQKSRNSKRSRHQQKLLGTGNSLVMGLGQIAK